MLHSIYNCFDKVGSLLQKPSYPFFREKTGIFTTNTIFASHFSQKCISSNASYLHSANEAKKIKKIELQSKVLKTVWIVTIALPILFFGGELCKKIALRDKRIQDIYNKQKMLKQLDQKAKKLESLKCSISQFVDILENVGCKNNRQEIFTCSGTDQLHKYADTHFTSRHEFDKTVIRASSHILGLIKDVYGTNVLTSRKVTFKDATDEQMISNFELCFDDLHSSNRRLRNLIGDETFLDQWNYQTSRKERFLQMCDTHLETLKGLKA